VPTVLFSSGGFGMRRQESRFHQQDSREPFGFYPKGSAVRGMLRSSSKLLPRFAYGLPRSPNPALEKPKDCSVTPLNLDRFVWCCRNNFIQFMAQNRNIWIDMARTTLYLVARLLVTFPGERLKGIRCESGTAPQR
jgi:hypothetical protein